MAASKMSNTALAMALLLALAFLGLLLPPASGQEVGETPLAEIAGPVGEVLLNLTTPRSPATGGLAGKVVAETLIFQEAIEAGEPEEGEDDFQETTFFINKKLPNINVTYTAPGEGGGGVAPTTLFANYTFVPGTTEVKHGGAMMP